MAARSGHAGHKDDGVTGGESAAPLESILTAAGSHVASCGHCVGAPTMPAKESAKVVRSEERRDDVAAGVLHTRRHEVLAAVASFPALSPSQGSPPAPAGRRKHLILSTFLI